MTAPRLPWIAIACAIVIASVPYSQGGWLKRRIYTGIPGTSITNLYGTNDLGQVVFPNSPTSVDTIPVLPLTGPFVAEAQPGITNNYGSWTPGYLEPPQTGDYRFWINGDDTAELWLTFDPATPA